MGARGKFLVSAFAIGIYVTLILIVIAHGFYSSKLSGSLGLFLSTAHQKSIDYRLLARGIRTGSPDLALLAVDDRSIEEIGRWPWPRETLAELIEKTLGQGVQIVGFDSVFSEPSLNSGEELLNQVRSKTDLPTKLETLFEDEVKKRDSDRIFAEAIARHAKQIVLGSFYNYEETNDNSQGAVDMCETLAFEQKPAFEQWRRMARGLSVKLKTQSSVPFFDIIKDIYKAQLSEIRENIIANSPQARTAREQSELEIKISNAERHFCRDFLKPSEDPLFSALTVDVWREIQNKEPALRKYPSFADYASALAFHAIRSEVPVGLEWVMNINEIANPAQALGFFHADHDADGTIRRSRLLVRSGEHYMPSLALSTFLKLKNYYAEVLLGSQAEDKTARVLNFDIKNAATQQTEFSVPVDPRGRMIINYAGPAKSFPHISAASLLTDSPDLNVGVQSYDPARHGFFEIVERKNKKEFLKGKTLIFGVTAMGVYDSRVTPFQVNYPGAETHLNVLDNLLRQDFLRVSDQEPRYMLMCLFLLGVALSFAMAELSAVRGVLVTALTLFAIALIDKYFLFSHGLVVAIIFPLLLVASLYVIMTFYKYLTEERGKKELRSTFQKYVSPAIVEEILSDPSKLKLGGRKAKVTVYFSDLRDFTTISEKLDPAELSQFLNRYLTPMTELVFKNRGTLDKYMGDAIMAFFGAPLTFPDHAKWGARCALQSLECLKSLQTEFAKKGLPKLDIGIGLNTGEVSVGNMGSETVRSYTVMGDAVNLASRLEGVNKQYGTRALISEFTKREIEGDFLCREIDWVRVKGKAQPVKIYELLCEGKGKNQTVEFVQTFEDATRLYHQREWQKALTRFEESLQLAPHDKVASIYLQRCKTFLNAPPPDEWDGVFVLTEK